LLKNYSFTLSAYNTTHLKRTCTHLHEKLPAHRSTRNCRVKVEIYLLPLGSLIGSALTPKPSKIHLFFCPSLSLSLSRRRKWEGMAFLGFSRFNPSLPTLLESLESHARTNDDSCPIQTELNQLGILQMHCLVQWGLLVRTLKCFKSLFLFLFSFRLPYV
jgi:hypothetical protein